MQTLTTADTAPKGVVLYDGECAFCRRTVGIVKKLDWLGRLRYHNCRDVAAIPPNAAHLNPEKMIEEMHLLTPDRQRAFSGFKAVRWIMARLPLTWPLWPFMFVPGVPQIGQRVYLLIAKHRFKLVPCHDGVCTIPPKRS